MNFHPCWKLHHLPWEDFGGLNSMPLKPGSSAKNLRRPSVPSYSSPKDNSILMSPQKCMSKGSDGAKFRDTEWDASTMMLPNAAPCHGPYLTLWQQCALATVNFSPHSPVAASKFRWRTWV